LPTYLEQHLAADETEVATQLSQEVAQVAHQALVQVGFVMRVGQIEELDEVGVSKDRLGAGVEQFQGGGDFRRIQHRPLEQGARELAFEVAAGPPLPGGKPDVELPFLGPLTPAQNEEVMGPGHCVSSAGTLSSFA
jgi:hypothetical protein